MFSFSKSSGVRARGALVFLTCLLFVGRGMDCGGREFLGSEFTGGGAAGISKEG